MQPIKVSSLAIGQRFRCPESPTTGIVQSVSPCSTTVDEFHHKSVEFDAVDKDGKPKKVRWSTGRHRTTYSNAYRVIPIDENGSDLTGIAVVNHFLPGSEE